ncbi:hypothetical protein ColLi_09723 [Colletotrichum liriopes]|uniref:Uncharacterized protein n=1 Tax=Colletotrichum liriopes TaxID=708192 RepID=A0AA37GTF5_9PEZI|nr:hypothetical protein ColLi_09723 [Colletotrichum liriopes]
MPVVTVAQLAVEVVYLVFPVLATTRAISEYGQRMPLNQSHASDVAKSVCSSVYVGPYNINIVIVDQVLPADVSLESDRALDGGELVLDLHKMVVDYHAFASRVPDPVWLTKTDKKFELAWICIGAVTGVESMRKDIGRDVGWNWTAVRLVPSAHTEDGGEVRKCSRSSLW